MIGREIASYKIVRQIASGGMGVVYEGEHVRIGSRVAVKILKPSVEKDPTLPQRVLNEARAVHKVGGDGVVKTHDAGVLEDGTPYIVMELLVGENLAERLKKEDGRLTIPVALRLVMQIAKTMATAHSQGLVHRDLKPENLFLLDATDRTKGAEISVKILDFGLVKVELPAPGTRRLTRPGQRFGTFQYTAPEQCQDAGNVDGKADVYSLGIILYQMIAGRTPFAETQPMAVVMNHLKMVPPPITQFAPQTSLKLASFIEQMLAKQPQNRPTMEEVANLVTELLAGTDRGAPGNMGPMPTLQPSVPPAWLDAPTAPLQRVGELDILLQADARAALPDSHEPQVDSSSPKSAPTSGARPAFWGWVQRLPRKFLAVGLASALLAGALTTWISSHFRHRKLAPITTQPPSPVGKLTSQPVPIGPIARPKEIPKATGMQAERAHEQPVSQQRTPSVPSKAAPVSEIVVIPDRPPPGPKGRAVVPEIVAPPPPPEPERTPTSVDITVAHKLPAQRLKAAQSNYEHKLYDMAILESYPILKSFPLEGRWIIAMSACYKQDKVLAENMIKALRKLESQKTEDAISEINLTCKRVDILKSAPTNSHAIIRSTEEFYEEGLFRQARQLAAETLALYPSPSWDLIGRSSCALGDKKRANDALRALSEKPNFNAAYINKLIDECSTFGLYMRDGVLVLK